MQLIKKIFSLFFIISFLPAILYADSFLEKEKAVDSVFASGDDLALWQAFKALLTGEQADWRSSLYYPSLSYFADVVGYKDVSDTFAALLKSIDSQPAAPERNMRRMRLLLEFEKFQLRYPQASLPAAKVQPIEVWHAAGPYKLYGKADLTHPFAPELENEQVPRRLVRAISDTGYIDLPYAEDGIAYASVSFKANKPLLLHIISESNYIFFINGKDILNNSGGKKQNYRIARVESAGDISITLKIQKNNKWRFKVFATDVSYNPVRLTCEPGAKYKNAVNCFEEDVYPLKNIRQMSQETLEAKAERHLRSGLFYDELASLAAVEEYRLAASYNNNSICRYHHALALSRAYNDEEAAWSFAESRRIMDVIRSSDTDFAPAQLARFDILIRERNIDEALRTGADLLAEYPYNFSAYLKYLGFLNDINYEKEFSDTHEMFAKNFPDSIYPQIQLAAYQKKRNLAAFAKTAAEILKVRKNENMLLDLFEYYMRSGDYTAAIELAKSSGRSDANMLQADAYIARGDFETAKKIMFKEIAFSPSASAYYTAGLAEYLNGGDPIMFWQSAAALDASLFDFQEYCDYLQNAKLNVPLRSRNYLTEDIGKILGEIKAYRQPSRVISRSRIFLLEKTASRVFCQDVIHLNNEQGLEAWGEYKIPYGGIMKPVVFRVYYDDGSFSDTYSVNNIEGTYYVNLVGLKKNSVLVMQYIVENPVDIIGDTSFYTMGTDFLQSYEEPLDSFDISIISDSSLPLFINGSEEWAVNVSELDGKRIYRFGGGEFPAVYYEKFSGSSENILPWYTFSTLSSENDLAVWYNSLIAVEKSAGLDEYAKKLQAKDAEQTLKNVYDYMARDIILTSNMLYYPDTPLTVLYRKSGSAEDKVLAAREILASLGIFSYPALARSKARPLLNHVRSPDFFDSILLYIPMSAESGVWWDFSDRSYSWTSVSPLLIDQEAWILVNDSWEKKKITADVSSGYTGSYVITIDKDGDGLCKIQAGFSGIYSVYRRFFSDKQYLENNVNVYCGGLFPSFGLNEYLVENIDNYNEALKLYAEGTVLSVVSLGTRRLVFEPIKNKSAVNQYVLYPSRKHTLIIAPVYEREKYEYIFPDNFAEADINKEINVSGSFGYAKFIFAKKKGEKKLTVTKDITVSKTIISPEEYGEFLEFCVKIREAETFNIIFHANR